MKRKVRILALVLVVILSLALTACSRYLAQVYKVYGTVTDSDGVPLESVEVFISGYQYSELTNGVGDYEMELARGSWSLDFVRQDYETWSTTVTVSPRQPRVRVDAALVSTLPPEEPSWAELLDGVWFGEDQPFVADPATADVQMTFHADDATYEIFEYSTGTPDIMTGNRGTFEANETTITVHATDLYVGGEDPWQPFEVSGEYPYTLEESVLTLYQDLSAYGGAADTVWTLAKQGD